MGLDLLSPDTDPGLQPTFAHKLEDLCLRSFLEKKGEDGTITTVEFRIDLIEAEAVLEDVDINANPYLKWVPKWREWLINKWQEQHQEPFPLSFSQCSVLGENVRYKYVAIKKKLDADARLLFPSAWTRSEHPTENSNS